MFCLILEKRSSQPKKKKIGERNGIELMLTYHPFHLLSLNNQTRECKKYSLEIKLLPFHSTLPKLMLMSFIHHHHRKINPLSLFLDYDMKKSN